MKSYTVHGTANPLQWKQFLWRTLSNVSVFSGSRPSFLTDWEPRSTKSQWIHGLNILMVVDCVYFSLYFSQFQSFTNKKNDIFKTAPTSIGEKKKTSSIWRQTGVVDVYVTWVSVMLLVWMIELILHTELLQKHTKLKLCINIPSESVKLKEKKCSLVQRSFTHRLNMNWNSINRCTEHINIYIIYILVYDKDLKLLRNALTCPREAKG